MILVLDFQVFVDGADAGMRYVDDCIGRLLELLEDKEYLKNAEGHYKPCTKQARYAYAHDVQFV